MKGHELADRLGLSIEQVSDGLRNLENEGILGVYKRTPYPDTPWIHLTKRYLEGIHATTTTSDTTTTPKKDGSNRTRAHGPSADMEGTVDSWIKGVKFHPPARVHGLRMYGRLDPLTAEYLRSLCQQKGDDSQWWTGTLTHGKFRVSPRGGFQLYPKDADSMSPVGEELARILKKGGIQANFTVEGEFGYRPSGPRIEEIRKGRCRLQFRNYSVEVYFDHSQGIEGEHRIKVDLSGDLESAKEMSLSLAVPFYLQERLDSIDHKLDSLVWGLKGGKIPAKIPNVKREEHDG